MRFNQKAHLITEARYQAWYDLAIQTAGLMDLERAILAAVVAYYQRLAERGYAGLLSYERLADATGWPDVQSIKAAVRHLVSSAWWRFCQAVGRGPTSIFLRCHRLI